MIVRARVTFEFDMYSYKGDNPDRTAAAMAKDMERFLQGVYRIHHLATVKVERDFASGPDFREVPQWEASK